MAIDENEVDKPDGDASGQTTLREQLESAVEQAETPPAEKDTPAESPPAEKPAHEGQTGDTDPEQVGARQRDEHGRFAPKEAPRAGTQPAAASGAPPGTQQKFDRAPPDWSVKAREAWGKVPPEAREEAWKLHVDARRALQQADTIRQQAAAPLQELSNIAQQHPYAFQGRDVFQVVGNLVRMANIMESPQTPPEVKARMVADWLDSFGIPEQLVGSAIDARRQGRPGPQSFGPQQQQFRDPRVDQLFGALSQQQQQQAYAERVEGWNEVAAFAEGKEFYEDVRNLMADIVEARDRNKQKFTLDEVYNLAMLAHPQVQAVVKQREAAAKASAGHAAKARAASGATLRSSGLPTPAKAGDTSIRGLLENAISEGQ